MPGASRKAGTETVSAMANEMENGKPPRIDGSAAGTRRQALALMLGAGVLNWLPRALAAADAPLRLAFSESLVTDVNINDARAAMLIWIKRLMVELNLVVEYSPKVFETT